MAVGAPRTNQTALTQAFADVNQLADTSAAALYMTRNPGNRVSQLLTLAVPSAPFQPQLATD